jgi:type I restriction enzyme S subunit
MLPDAERLNREYLAYYLRSKSFVDWVSAQVAGAKMPRVSMKLFWDHKIPLPSLSEQNRIAKILEKADVICQKRQQAIQLVDELIRAVFLDMFGGPEANMRGWAVKPLDEYLTFLTSGSRGWAKYYSETGSKFIRIQNVSKNKLLLSDMAFVNAPQGAEANRTKVQVGDVLLSITADLGRSSVVTKDIAGGHINQHLALLRLSNERLNPRYLSAYLSSTAGINQFMKKNKSAVKAGLNFTDIKTLEVPVPPIAEQLSYEKTYDKAISLQVEQFRSLEEAKKSFGALSQKAFTGKL